MEPQGTMSLEGTKVVSSFGPPISSYENELLKKEQVEKARH